MGQFVRPREVAGRLERLVAFDHPRGFLMHMAQGRRVEAAAGLKQVLFHHPLGVLRQGQRIPDGVERARHRLGQRRARVGQYRLQRPIERGVHRRFQNPRQGARPGQRSIHVRARRDPSGRGRFLGQTRFGGGEIRGHLVRRHLLGGAGMAFQDLDQGAGEVVAVVIR